MAENKCPEGLLRTEGIMAKGYGLIPKLVMTEPSLSITSKAIYAYLCSLAGSGTTAFPSVKTIIYNLSINKDTFYKHFNMLEERDLISVSQSFQQSSRFGCNVYELATESSKLVAQRCGKPVDGLGTMLGLHVKSSAAAQSDLNSQPTMSSLSNQDIIHSRFVATGIKKAGYGMLPRVVMQSAQLTHKAKAVYAYFCSFAGAGTAAFPSRKVILYHLDISQPTYYKALHELTDAGYLIIKQRKLQGRFAVCDYYLADTLKPPCAKISDTVKQDTVISDTEKPDAGKPDAGKPDAEISATTNTSPKNNRNSSSNNSPSISYQDWRCELDLSEPDELTQLIAQMDRKTISEYIAKDIGLDIREILSTPEIRKKVVYLIDLVSEALFYPKLRVGGTDYPPWQFQKRLLSLSLEEYLFVLNRVNQVQGVRNLKAYYLASLYNAYEDMERAIDQEVQADMK